MLVLVVLYRLSRLILRQVKLKWTEQYYWRHFLDDKLLFTKGRIKLHFINYVSHASIFNWYNLASLEIIVHVVKINSGRCYFILPDVWASELTIFGVASVFWHLFVFRLCLMTPPLPQVETLLKSWLSDNTLWSWHNTAEWNWMVSNPASPKPERWKYMKKWPGSTFCPERAGEGTGRVSVFRNGILEN
jgi:hypothetical protein